MAELPRMPVDVAKLLADTTYMSTEERGAYFCILFTMWLHGGRLQDNEHELAHIAGVTARRWKKLQGRVKRPFTSAGGELSQKRLTATWLDVQELRAKHARGGNVRWRKHDARHGAANDAEHKHTKDSNIKPSDSESGTARTRDAEAPQDSRGKNVASPQLQRILKTPSRAGDQ